jgi:hypothetical protein
MTWKQIIAEIDGRQVLALVDDRFKEKVPIKELQCLSSLFVYCNQEAGSAFWNPDETETLDKIEDDLLRLCESFGHGWMVYALRAATSGMREYCFYHSDTAEIKKVMAALKVAHPSYRIEADTKNDPEWNEYQKYIPLLKLADT